MPVIINGSTGISGTDGSAGTPALQGTDTNTGVYFPAADTIAFSEGGVEAMRIDASGNVGIGTSSPAYKLEVAGASNTAVARIRSTDGTRCDLRFESTGSNSGLYFGNGTTFDIGRLYYDNVGNSMQFWTNSTERARITSTGDFQFNSGYGSVATAYGCRAWVNFNGTGTVAIRASGNVSSITDNGIGDYTVNFTTPMSDVNYSISAIHSAGSGGTVGTNINVSGIGASIPPTTSAFRIVTVGGGNIVDPLYVNAFVVR